MLNNMQHKLVANKYIHNEVVKKTARMRPGIKRTLLRVGGCAAALVKHHFKLWDYQHEMDLVKKNNYIFCFEKYDKNIMMYLPGYEEDYIQDFIVECSDFYEADELEYLRNTFLKTGNVILDIGANIGNHAVFFTKICNAEKVYAFEPIAETYNILCRNIVLNHIEDTVVAYNVALGNSSGKAKVKYFNHRSTGETQVEAADDGDLDMKRLDDYEFERIDFIKIDIEKHEYDFLLGAKETLSKHSPVIFIEIFDDCFSVVDKLLRSYGYTNSSSIESNYIYVKRGSCEVELPDFYRF